MGAAVGRICQDHFTDTSSSNSVQLKKSTNMLSIDVLIRDRLVNAQRIFGYSKSQSVNIACPVSQVRMVNPAKSLNCRHIERVELKVMLEHIRRTGTWECVYCKCGLRYSQIYVDKLMRQAIAEQTDNQAYVIMIMTDNSYRAVKQLSSLETTVMISAFTIAARNLKARRNKKSEEYIGVVPPGPVLTPQSHFISRLAAKAERTKRAVKEDRKFEKPALQSDPRYSREV